MSTGEERSRTINTIERAVGVLLLFAQSDRQSLGVTEISNMVGLSKAVVHRVLTTLLAQDLVSVDPDTRRYRLGPTVMALSNAYLSHLDLRQEAQFFLKALSTSTGETSTLSIRTGFTRFYADQVTPPREVRMTVQLGVPYPLHAGSSSKAFLAFLSDSDQDDYLRSTKLDALTSATITSESDLRQELDRIRSQGYAVSFGERQSGAASVAAPVFGHTGQVTAVMSVCGPLERMKDSIDSAATTLVEQARGMSKRLGHVATV